MPIKTGSDALNARREISAVGNTYAYYLIQAAQEAGAVAPSNTNLSGQS